MSSAARSPVSPNRVRGRENRLPQRVQHDMQDSVLSGNKGPRGHPTPRPMKEPKVAETTSGAVTRSEVLEIVRNQLAEILEIDASGIEESSSFADDLDADSLALIELVEALEEELSDKVPGFRIDDEDLEDLRTVRDAVDYVTAKLGA